MTESGKTTLAKLLIREFRRNDIKCVVLDPLFDPSFEADFQTSDRDEFLRIVKGSRSLAIFVDEAGESVGRYDSEMHWLATRGRHYGHSCYFLTQRGMQIAKTVRDQCSYLYLFACSRTDAKTLADEYNKPMLELANILDKGEFFVCPRFGTVHRGRIDFINQRVTLEELRNAADQSLGTDLASGGSGVSDSKTDEKPDRKLTTKESAK